MFAKLGLATIPTIAAIAFSIASSEDAHADVDFGNINAATCVPANTATQGNLYNIGAGSVMFNGTATGLLTLYCPIPPIAAGVLAIQYGAGHAFCYPDHFKVAYIDSDGTGSAVQVDAQAIKMDPDSGAVTILGTFLSSAFAGGASEVHNPATWTTQDWPTYIRVDMERTSSGQTAQLYSVDMYGVTNCP